MEKPFCLQLLIRHQIAFFGAEEENAANDLSHPQYLSAVRLSDAPCIAGLLGGGFTGKERDASPTCLHYNTNICSIARGANKFCKICRYGIVGSKLYQYQA